MVYRDYAKEKKRLETLIKWLVVAMVIYVVASLVSQSVILVFFLLAAWFIPCLAVYSVLKDKQAKEKEDKMKAVIDPDTLIERIETKKTKGQRLSKHDLILLTWFLIILLFLVDTDIKGLRQVYNIGLVSCLMLSLFVLLRKYFKEQVIFFDKGLIVNKQVYALEDLKKYQAIKLRRGDFILEMQVKEVYASLVLSPNDLAKFESFFKSHKPDDLPG